MCVEYFKKPWVWVSLIYFLVFVILLGGLGYSAGYGKELAGGEVVYERESLAQHIMVDYKRDGGEWSFGYFVPVGVIVLFWLRRNELLQTPVKPAIATGLIVLLLSFFLYWAGFRGEQKYFGYASLQFLTLGGVLWFLGWAWFRKIFWLWALLGMMWPWRFLIGRVSAPLQGVMVKLTSAFMNLIGVEAVSNGSSLKTASLDPVTNVPISLDVDVACSGMRSLFALIMIGLIFSFLRVKDEWKRWLLMLLVPVVVILGNFVRMLMLYGGSTIWGTEVAIGEGHNMSLFHLFAGLMVFAVALAILSGVVAVIDGETLKKKNRKQIVTRTVDSTVTEGDGE